MRYFYQHFEEEKHFEDIDSFASLRENERRLVEAERKRIIAKPEQAVRFESNEKIGLDCVQAYVSNMTSYTSLDELDYFEYSTLPENLLGGPDNEWTAPKWAKAGDIVFFMHAKTANSKISMLRSELRQRQNEFSKEKYDFINKYLEHALDVYSKYGGKIFVLGRVCGAPENISSEDVYYDFFHWKSRNYAAIDNIIELSDPIDISEFRGYIQITRGGSVTPLFDDEIVKLRDDIGMNNPLPDYVRNAVARPVPLRKINDKNWLEIANCYRRSFILEKQFRKFYVDYLIRNLGDRRSFFTECRCQRSDINDSFMDYVMIFDGCYLPVEVKLSVSAEPNIVAQVSKYVFNSNVFLSNDCSACVTGDLFHKGKVLIIDTEKIYMYDAFSNRIDELLCLDSFRSSQHIDRFKKTLKTVLRG